VELARLEGALNGAAGDAMLIHDEDAGTLVVTANGPLPFVQYKQTFLANQILMWHGETLVQETVGLFEQLVFFITNRGSTPSREGATGTLACDEIAGETGGEYFSCQHA
jgi:hypothetical protein